MINGYSFKMFILFHFTNYCSSGIVAVFTSNVPFSFNKINEDQASVYLGGAQQNDDEPYQQDEDLNRIPIFRSYRNYLKNIYYQNHYEKIYNKGINIMYST
jgi:hypothetical protein